MGAFIESVTSILAQSARRTEIASANIAHIGAPGYARRVGFSTLAADSGGHTTAQVAETVDLRRGALQDTGAPYDLALEGAGFFVVRSESGTAYTRNGQFRRAADGRLLTPEGYALQTAGGGDVVLTSGAFTVAADGTLIQDGPAGRIGVVDFESVQALTPLTGTLFAAAEGAAQPLEAPVVRQGQVEASNVSAADEMVSIMAALRHAQAGQRLAGVYDELLGRAITAFGQG
jgi:flagellar basal-body rod protein FlgG